MNPQQSDIQYMNKLLVDLQPPSVDEVSKLIRKMLAKSSIIDSTPTSVLFLNRP